ncbi:D-sedoheptulose 7-phosphate isomerase [Pullulanibacillus pueri]|uniref:Phosphoheptose isomerase n=1 Tax=Pullulanibacillus pueri TaxID=1437324 RepID=A0A8J2ZX83_9BACL|nr:SIS domain-containing protein [Pullulanibacillus pueri]MBM7682909.1 D-sedoheptulose 7-phosphate isomerase [Pullulanibacillus pueri]GGH84815.1 phosphoheptose isomerase [Pullulanibacillus pueri]
MNHYILEVIDKYPELSGCADDIEDAYQLLKDCYTEKHKVLLCGNGGSAADCDHIVGELMKGFLLKRPVGAAFKEQLAHIAPEDATYLADHLQGALPVISLVSQSALMTAFSNDVASDIVFAQQVYGYGDPGDCVIGISTSGNSKNVLYALKVAKAKGLKTIGLTGRTGGEMESLCDITIKVPSDETFEIQERHLPIYHCLCMMLEEAFFSHE